MNADFDPEEPDAASDPLLAALRQHLGKNFGQAPPPQAWAGIRQRLAPRPWWQRPLALLPALTLLLSVCTVGGLLVARRHAAPVAAAAQPAATHPPVATTANANDAPASAAAPAVSALRPTELAAPVAVASSAAGQAADAPVSQLATLLPGSNGPVGTGQPVSYSPASRPVGASLAAVITGRAATVAAGTTSRHHYHAAGSPVSATGAATVATTAGSRGVVSIAHQAAGSRRKAYLATSAARHQLLAASFKGHGRHQVAYTTDLPTTATGLAGAGRMARRASETGRALTTAPTATVIAQRSRQLTGKRPQPISPPASAASATSRLADAELTQVAARSVEVMLLTVRPVSLPLLASARPATLAPLPDARQPRPPFRGWAVQVLGGPTLSYRAVPTSGSSLSSSRPAYYGYERPALGWGVQVQARRVLTGRWALAAGLGYHEYATRLDLQIRRPNDSTLLPVHQRDVYQMVTMPLQASYVLGAPRGPLELALLAGAEPGWYRGGRVTEGGDCACQQQTFAGAADSPYNALSVALSLGLDLRYRLGGPASRWQLLVQPTGRYVATPFVRNNVTGYVRRQPYSLGLLAGLAWDWR